MNEKQTTDSQPTGAFFFSVPFAIPLVVRSSLKRSDRWLDGEKEREKVEGARDNTNRPSGAQLG